MRKISVLLVVIIILTMVIMTGCTGSKKADSNNENPPVTASIISGGPNDKWYMLSNGIGEAMNRSYPGSILHIGPGTPISNLLNLNDNAAEFALFHTDIAFEAYRGLGQFEEAKTNISTVAVLYPSPAQMVFRNDLGITSFGEIIENRIPVNISMGRVGSSSSAAFTKILNEYGITVDDMTAWGCKMYEKGFADTAEMFADEIIDGCFIIAGEPTVFITQLSVNKELILLEWDQKILDAMCEKYGFAYHTISSNTYTFMEKDCNSFNSFTLLGAALSASEDIVYKVTKSIYENRDYIKSLHASFDNIDFDNIAADSGAPLHPGAERYYKEAGLID